MTRREAAPQAFRKILTISVPVLLGTLVLISGIIEVWVRASWNPRRGSPGLFVSDAYRGQRLAPNYDGWFAGVPVRINNLGFRDDRDYELAKRPDTFRILVLGDSVTFGHGSVHTYPRLLEDALEAWRPDIDWQVWNAAVPGYNTTQELAHLLDVGPAYEPDLVVVGFFENDLMDNRPLQTPGAWARASSRLVSWLQRHLYSFEFYKRLALQAAYALSRDDEYRRRVEHLGTESALLASVDQTHTLEEQQLTPYERLSDRAVAGLSCEDGERADHRLLDAIRQQPGWPAWLAAIRRFQELHREGRYRIVFFLQIVPPACPGGDFFYGGGTRVLNDFLMDVLTPELPAVSTLDAFLHRRPSQMPAARAHAIGNSNQTKAEALFEYLSRSMLPALLAAR